MHQMLTLLDKSTPALCRFLGEALPRVSPDCWNTRVTRNLMENLARVVRQKVVSSLDGLDLAALLRVFDANYYEVSNATDLPRETGGRLKVIRCDFRVGLSDFLPLRHVPDLMNQLDVVPHEVSLLEKFVT